MYYLLRGFIFANKASYPSVLFDPLFITALTENEITPLSQTKIHAYIVSCSNTMLILALSLSCVSKNNV